MRSSTFYLVVLLVSYYGSGLGLCVLGKGVAFLALPSFITELN
jgi:hypothetical protein